MQLVIIKQTLDGIYNDVRLKLRKQLHSVHGLNTLETLQLPSEDLGESNMIKGVNSSHTDPQIIVLVVSFVTPKT